MKYTSDTTGIKALTFSYAAFVWSSAFVVLQELLTSIVLCMYFLGKPNVPQSLQTLIRTTDIVLKLDVVSLSGRGCRVSQLRLEVPKTCPRFETLEHQNTSEIKDAVNILGISAVIALSAIIYERIGSLISDRITVGRETSLFVHFTHVTQSIATSFRMVNARMKKEIFSYIVEGIETNNSLPDVNVIHPAGKLELVNAVSIVTESVDKHVTTFRASKFSDKVGLVTFGPATSGLFRNYKENYCSGKLSSKMSHCPM
ncbi:hypothetical protein J6590_071952 [Homalodisca vitripennis]|nr:hypothetical protein J6590_071952 [Homalodisca vitripennis]